MALYLLLTCLSALKLFSDFRSIDKRAVWNDNPIDRIIKWTIYQVRELTGPCTAHKDVL